MQSSNFSLSPLDKKLVFAFLFMLSLRHYQKLRLLPGLLISAILFKYRYRRYFCGNVSVRVSAILFNAKYCRYFHRYFLFRVLVFEFA
jgi:hypothetical protein